MSDQSYIQQSALSAILGPSYSGGLVSSYVLEGIVFQLFSGALSMDETILQSPSLGKAKGYRPDFFLPQGLSALGLAPGTVVEVVSVLNFDTVKRRLIHLEDFEHKEGDWHYQLVIVYLTSSIEILVPTEVSGRFLLFSIEDLKNRLSYVEITPVKTRDWKTKKTKRIIDAQYHALRGEVSFFLGAGVSIDAGLPSWKDLLNRLVAILKNQGKSLDYSKTAVDADNSNLIIARAIRHAFGSDDAFKKAVRDALYQTKSHSSSLVDALSDIIYRNDNIVKVITYNFDDVLEQGMKKDYCFITNSNRIDPGYFPIYHVHGYLPESKLDYPSWSVFSEEEYHDVYKNAYHWSNLEQLHSLANTTCFFVGLSLKDPNIRRLLEIAKERDHDVYHYAFLRRPDFKDPEMVDSLLDELRVKVIWYWTHKQLPRLLKRVFV